MTGTRSRRWRRGLLVLLVVVPFLIGGVFLAYPVAAAGAPSAVPAVTRCAPAAAVPPGPLLVMTMNLAHGRGAGRHQLLQSAASHREHLAAAAALLRREAPAVVALQEADGPSFWSGGFDHVQALAGDAGLTYAFHGFHMDGLGLHYGTALASRLPPGDPRMVTFTPRLGSSTKGFVRATFPWPGTDRSITIASVHLDFALPASRRLHAAELVAGLRGVPGPLCVLGDFNCDLAGDATSLPFILESLQLHTWQPEAGDLVTFPATGQRLDWVLVSAEIEILEHRVLEDVVSDHRVVLVTLALGDEEPR